jgi:hypothetical protein
MTTSAQAVEKMAEVTGLLPNSLVRITRFLREAGGDLWPQGFQGKGREAHVEAHHLVNLVLALGAADMTDSPQEAISRAQLVQAELRVTEMRPL